MDTLPEVTFNARSLNEFIGVVSKALIDFEIVDIVYLNTEHQNQSFVRLPDLLSQLQLVKPTKRSNFSITFNYRRDSENPKLTTGTIYFNSNVERAKVEILGGTKKIRNEERARLLSIFSKFKRTFSNQFIKFFVPITSMILFFTINYVLFPERIVSGTPLGTYLIALISLPLFIYSYYRPHVFLTFRVTDSLSVFPGPLRLTVSLIVWLFIAWAFVQSPRWFGRDNSLVASSPELQREILRRVIASDFLNKIESLRITNEIYDKSEKKAHKVATSKILVDQIYELIGKNKVLQNYPIGALPFFLSSAYQIQSKNWAAEPLLLMSKIHLENGEVTSARFLMHIDGGSRQPNPNVTFKDWLAEPIIKDKYGRIWTRETLIEDKKAESTGKLDGTRLDDLQRLRNYPDESFVFLGVSGKENFVENTIEEDSVRAISEEIVRSMNNIQRKLSEDPQVYRP